MCDPIFSASIVTADTVAIVVVRGELDLATAPELREALAACLDGGYSTIDVDMQGVTFMACAGINVLVGARRRAAAAGLHVAVVRPSPVAERLLTLGRVRSLLKLTDSDSIDAVSV